MWDPRAFTRGAVWSHLMLFLLCLFCCEALTFFVDYKTWSVDSDKILLR